MDHMSDHPVVHKLTTQLCIKFVNAVHSIPLATLRRVAGRVDQRFTTVYLSNQLLGEVSEARIHDEDNSHLLGMLKFDTQYIFVTELISHRLIRNCLGTLGPHLESALSPECFRA